MLCLCVLRSTEQQRGLLSYNIYFLLGRLETYQDDSITYRLMVGCVSKVVGIARG